MTLVIGAAWCLAIAGIMLGAASLLVFRRPLVALPVMLELFTAAGLLRLSVDLSWAGVAGIAALIALRRVITRSLSADLTAGPFGARRTTA
jgi:hypothetical protein